MVGLWNGVFPLPGASPGRERIGLGTTVSNAEHPRHTFSFGNLMQTLNYAPQFGATSR